MTSGRAGAIEAVISRVDWLADRGSLVMKVGAVGSWVGAIAATAVLFSRLSAIGWLLGAFALVPGWILWRYGRGLAAALDGEKVRGQLGGVADLAKGRLVDVVDGIQDTRRQMFRGGFKVLKTVRGLRGDFENFGIDVSGIAKVANPARLSMVGFSLLASLGLWVLALITIALRAVF